MARSTVNDSLAALEAANDDGAAGRCVATFASMAEVEAKGGALVAIVKQWLEQM